MKRIIITGIIFCTSYAAFPQSTVDKNTVAKTQPVVEIRAAAIPAEQMPLITAVDYHKEVNTGTVQEAPQTIVAVTATAEKNTGTSHERVRKEIQIVGVAHDNKASVTQKTVEITLVATKVEN
jgi:hypothetical protein